MTVQKGKDIRKVHVHVIHQVIYGIDVIGIDSINNGPISNVHVEGLEEENFLPSGHKDASVWDVGQVIANLDLDNDFERIKNLEIRKKKWR